MKKFELRKWKNDDVANLVKYANNRKIARYMTDSFPHPYSENDADRFIEFARSHEPQRIFAITVDNEAVGGIGVHPQQDIQSKNAELGYWLAEPFWGQGIVSEAVKEMIEYGFKNFDIDRIFARPFGTNLASQKVLEKTGFTLEGKFEKALYKWGEYEDELIYAIRRPAPGQTGL